MGMNRRVAIVVFACTLALGTAAIATAGAQAAGWSTPVAPLSQAAVPALDVNARGDVVEAIAASGSGALVADRPAGGAFATPVPVPGPTGYNARVAINGRGDTVVAWEEASHIYYAVRPAGGAFRAANTITVGLVSSLDRVRVAIDDGGEVAVAWAAVDAGKTVLRWALTNVDGTNAALTTYSESAPGQNVDSAFDVDMNPRGDAIVVWSRTNGTNYIAQASTRSAGGAFASPTDVSPTGVEANYVSADLDAAGRAVVTWMRWDGTAVTPQLAFHPAGGVFSLPTSPALGAARGAYPAAALADDGDVIVAWRDEASGNVAARVGTFGQLFTAPVVTFTSGGGAVAAAVAPDGRATLTWATGTALHAATRPPGGTLAETATVTGDVQLYSVNIAQTPVAVDQAGDAVAAWLGSGQVGSSTLDVTGPELRSLAVPASATAGTAVGGFSVAPFDTFSAVGTPHWDFGDGGPGADGASVAHTYATAGTYTVTVTATDAAGNASSATRSIAIAAATTKPPPLGGVPPKKTTKCRVPKLTGLTYAQAKAKLTSGHCKVGKTKKPKGHKTTKNLVVRTQSRRAGTSITAGAKVDITMKVKPKKKVRKK